MDGQISHNLCTENKVFQNLVNLTTKVAQVNLLKSQVNAGILLFTASMFESERIWEFPCHFMPLFYCRE